MSWPLTPPDPKEIQERYDERDKGESSDDRFDD